MNDSCSTELTNAVSALNTAAEAYHSKIAEIDAHLAMSEQKIETLKTELSTRIPVTPNLLEDSKYFSSLCNGEVNVTKEIVEAHNGSRFAVNTTYNGTVSSGTLEIVTLDQLASKGIPYGGDLERAITRHNNERPFYGADFHIALFDVNIESTTGVSARLYVLNQGCQTFSGWYSGEFKTQSSAFFNVIEHSGDIRFYSHANRPAHLSVGEDDLNAGWIYKHNTRIGWGGCHQPIFNGVGHMKVALALPYIGFGDHDGLYIHANSVGLYSHGADYL